MASPALPREIRLNIFKCCSCISDAVHLAKTARTFNDTWSHFTKSICETILSRTVKYYEGAKVLVTAQETGLSPTDQEHVLAYFSNARIVEQACDALQETLMYRIKSDQFRPQSAEVGSMTQTERARFAIAYYRICALSIVLAKSGGHLATTPIPSAAANLLDALKDYDLSVMHELALGYLGRFDYTERLTLGMNGTISPARFLGFVVHGKPPDPRFYPWEAASFVLRKCLSKRFKTDIGTGPFTFFDRGLAVLFDCCQDDFQEDLARAANGT
ncbi:MAG: hypothetical protein Q9182_002608 [Xanthomendoza sp. 2 TL-2023]